MCVRSTLARASAPAGLLRRAMCADSSTSTPPPPPFTHLSSPPVYNPSPFSVISDEWADQIVRTLPLLAWPLIMPTNMCVVRFCERKQCAHSSRPTKSNTPTANPRALPRPSNLRDLLFAQFSLLFYAYGVYLHWGFETPLISAHNPIINGAYEHWYHHAKSGANTPIYTGFFFKLWDQLVGTSQTEPCVCSRCEVAAGRRSKKQWEKVTVPDYSVLLQPSFWLAREAAAGAAPAEGPASAAKTRARKQN